MIIEMRIFLKHKKLRFASLLLLTVVISVGCIYTFNPKGKSEIGSLSIPPFENKTGEFGFASRLTDLVIDQFIADGNMKVLSLANAEATLVGVLLSYERLPQVFDENEKVESYKIRLSVEVTLKKNSDQSEIWKERMTPEGIYAVLDESEEDGQRKAAIALVEAIINRTTQSW